MNEILSVSELTLCVKKHLESQFPFVCVKGEISNFKQQASGHLYFTLKDSEAQISAVLFKGNTKNLARLPKEGDEVICKGELSVYAPRGSYQILVRELQFAGVGELLLKLHQLKNTLQNRGWLDPFLKKPLPKFPKTIGVVTSPTGAVIQDIIHVLSRRYPNFHLILNPVKVQGEGAAQEIALAIEQFNKHNLADVIIVGRGGGSLEDLWAFNEEIVAKAIFESKIPIISAVGHETDYSIADFVADVRAPTPSAAAELVIGEKAHYLKQLAQNRHRAAHALLSNLKQYQLRLDDKEEKLTRNVKHFIAQKRLRLLALQKQKEALMPTTQLAQMKVRLKQIERAMEVAGKRLLQNKKEKMAQLLSHLKSVDPKNVLTKGYCILFPEKENSVILSTKNLQPQTAIRILLHDGEAKAKVL